jgi:preprotein translocase subunit SecD
MIIYYKRAGVIASAALLFTVLFTLGILAGFGATLTLPGIAGIILTIGMSVDSNVLIYERIREEMATGKTVKASVDSGFKRANSAIIDSNLTTFITGIILYQFGTGPVQGFALTLMIGIVASLFSALVVARLIFDYMTSKNLSVDVG